MVFRLVSFWSSYQVDKEVSWMSLWVNPRTPFLHFLLVIWLKVHYCSVIISMGWCDSNDHYAYIGSDLLSLISLFSNGLMPWCCVEAPMVQSESACRVATSRCGRQLTGEEGEGGEAGGCWRKMLEKLLEECSARYRWEIQSCLQLSKVGNMLFWNKN